MNINDFPPEVLSEIFLEANNEYCTVEMGKSQQRYVQAMHPRWAPFSLIHVCRYWREIALSIDPLWTSLCGDISTPTAIEQWITFSRSDSLRLALAPKLYEYPVLDDPIVDRAKQMLQLFARNSNRWESLYICTGHHQILHDFTSILKSCATTTPLRSLEIDFLNTPRSMIDELIPLIASLSSLRHFYWIVYSFNCTIPQIFPWDALETVYLESAFQVDEAIRCLMHCTSAKEVTLLAHPEWATGDEPPEDVMSTYKHTTLPKLKSLVLDNNCNPAALLQYFTLPSLSSLRVLSSRGCSIALGEFLAKSQCPLTKLIVGKEINQITEDDIVAYASIPYLKSVAEVRICTYRARNQFPNILKNHPDILDKIPRLTRWTQLGDWFIGWKAGSKKVLP